MWGNWDSSYSSVFQLDLTIKPFGILFVFFYLELLVKAVEYTEYQQKSSAWKWITGKNGFKRTIVIIQF